MAAKEDETLQVNILMKKLMRDAHFTRTYYDLKEKEVERVEVTKILEEVKILLKEYKDVTFKELPASLSPDRGIDHHIDLVLGSNLPK